MRISIVTTLYNSADTIAEFYKRAVLAVEETSSDYEVIFVDDGSQDDSLSIARDLIENDPNVTVVELSRNFGHHKAMMTGLEHATGDLVFLIDSDLEEDPGLLQDFFTHIQETDSDVVYGYQDRRKGRLVERFGGAIAYSLFEIFIPFKIPRNHITLRLMRREFVDALLRHREREIAIGGLWVMTGFRQKGLPVNKKSRALTTYGLLRRWGIMIGSIVSFSERPLILVFYIGLLIVVLSVVVAAWVIANKLIHGIAVDGWVSIMISLWFLGGLLIFCLGVVGLYVSKIFIETKNRPYTIIRRVYSKQ